MTVNRRTVVSCKISTPLTDTPRTWRTSTLAAGALLERGSPLSGDFEGLFHSGFIASGCPALCSGKAGPRDPVVMVGNMTCSQGTGCWMCQSTNHRPQPKALCSTGPQGPPSPLVTRRPRKHRRLPWADTHLLPRALSCWELRGNSNLSSSLGGRRASVLHTESVRVEVAMSFRS